MKKPYILVLLLCLAFTSYGQWTYTNLSVPKAYMGATSLGSKAYFAGGRNNSGLKSTVEIYDFSTGLWDTTQHLSIARELVTAATCGSKIFFAGGVDFSSGNAYATVDIYDTTNGTWDTATLSVPRVLMTALSYGNKVLFAGGANPQAQPYDNVDIYDAETDTWSVSHLSVPHFTFGGVVNSLGILPGGKDPSGVTKRVDIYNFSTGTWSVDSLSVARAWVGVTTIGNKMLIAGGATHGVVQSNVVDIYDATTGTWDDTTHISLARSFADNQNAVNACGKAYFIGGGKFNLNGLNWYAAYKRIDIYDLTTNTWSVDSIPTTTAAIHLAAVSVGDKFIIAGGTSSGTYISNAEIYTCPIYPGLPEVVSSNGIKIIPNPASDKIRVTIPEKPGPGQLSIFNVSGEKELEMQIRNNETQIDISSLQQGIYFVRLQNGETVTVGKLIK